MVRSQLFPFSILIFPFLAHFANFILGPEGQPCCNYNTYASWPMRATDTDETMHNYFSLMKIYAATGDEDPYIFNT